MEQTVHLGVTPAKAGDNQMGFDRLANQRLLPPTFPRYTEIKSRSEMATYFRRLVEMLVAATAVQNVTNLHAALEFFAEFSSNNPCVLSRSALQIMYAPFSAAVIANKGLGFMEQQQQQHGKAAPSPHGRAAPFVDILRDTCRSFVAPPGLTSKSVPFVQVNNMMRHFNI